MPLPNARNAAQGKIAPCLPVLRIKADLRYALYPATKYVCYWNPVFTEYLTKKQAEGKHYNVAQEDPETAGSRQEDSEPVVSDAEEYYRKQAEKESEEE